MFLRLSVVFCLALSLCACGGGGANATSNQNANGSHAVVITRVSPSNLSSATSPVNFDFTASSQTPIKGWTVTVDSKQVYQTGATSEIQTSLVISDGTHQVSVQASNSNGTIGSSDFALTVVSGSPSPTPTPTPRPSPTPTPTPAPSPTPTPGAHDFFVSPSGSDSNNGSVSAPWATIQHAADVVGAGATVFVADGTYTQCSGGTMVSIAASGSASSPITFQSQNKWGAKLVGDTSCEYGFAVRGSYINIKFFDISGLGANSSQGIYLAGGVHHTVFGNRIHNIANINTGSAYGNDGIFVGANSDLIDSNLIFDIGRTNFAFAGVDHGLYCDGSFGASDLTIQNNVIYNTPFGWPIQLFPGGQTNVLIINNTLDGQNPRVIGGIVQGSSTLSNSRIANNMIYTYNGAAINFSFGSNSGVTVDHNLTNASAMGDSSPSGVTFSGNITGASTSGLVTNEAGGDYHLVTGSPAVGAGSISSAPPTDFDGNSRGSRIDIGAYEYPH